jgi:hypothetical protein
MKKHAGGVAEYRASEGKTVEVSQGILRGEYHCTVDLLFDWFGISCMTTDNFCFLFAKQTNPNQSNRMSMVQ